MRKHLRISCFIPIFMLFLFASITPAIGQVTKNYPAVTLSDWASMNFEDYWDLTKGTLILSYTLDMSQMQTVGWAIVEVGLREIGAPNLDPDLRGGWLQSNYMYPTPSPSTRLNNDFHLLSKHSWMYQEYDVNADGSPHAPTWTGNNHGFWFDRDGVDPTQAGLWGAAGTYNTAGIYNIVITFQARDSVNGTMFVTINGVQQGIYTSGWKNQAPEFYPAGKSFIGILDLMQIFMGKGSGGNGWPGAPGGKSTISNVTVQGYLTPPNKFKQLATDAIANDFSYDKKIYKAYDHIQKSLELELWDSDYELAKKGKKVFEEEQKAADELLKAYDKKDIPTSVKNNIMSCINFLLKADRMLAQDAIDKGGDPKEIEKANEEMAKAQEEIGKKHYDKAIEHFGKAWEHAQHAQKKILE